MARQQLEGPRIEVRDGRVVIVRNGELVPQSVYCDYILRGDWEERNREFVQSGVRVFHLTVAHGEQVGGKDFYDTAFWPRDGVYVDEDPALQYSLDNQARMILAMQPDALFYIKFTVTPPSDWREKHVADMQTDDDGQIHPDASFCSERLLRDMDRFVRHVARHCESRPWGDRVLGYLMLPCGEGIARMNISGKMFDQSAASQGAFQAWVRQRYGKVAALRAAWGDSGASFASVRVPRDRDWLARRREARPTVKGKPASLESLPSNGGELADGLFQWTEESNVPVERDYCRFMREVFLTWARTIMRGVKETAAEFGRSRLVGMDIVKQHQIGWQILSSFDGIGDGQRFPSMFPLSGSIDMGELLDDAETDVVWNPADYFARTLGFAYESEGLTDSLALRGKVAFVENDARCYVGAGVRDQGAFRTPKEVEAGLLRNAALTLSRNVQSYWCNVGSSYFHDAEIQRTVTQVRGMLDRINGTPFRETRDAIAFVVDDASPLFEDLTSGYQTLALIMQRVRGLSHCGVPYRIYLLSDLANSAMPRYKTWFFPNLFRVDDDVMELLRAKVLRDGNVAIFGPSTGITDGRVLGAERATALLGVPMELEPRRTVRHVIVQDSGHRVSRELPASLVYGDSMPYGPTLVPGEWAVESAGAVPLGHGNACWFIHRTGLFINEFGRGAAGNGRSGKRGRGDYGVVWSVALPLPASLLRACARYAGSNVWCEDDDVIYACDSLVALHSVKKGGRTIYLPRPCTVTDAVTGRRLSKAPKQTINVRIAPPQTRIFELQ